jgi:hypothetical protein
MANSHPNAAIALLFLGKETPASSSGALYLEGVPSLQALHLLLDVDGSSSRETGELVLPRNPYSTTPYYVEVRWTVSARSEKSWQISMRAELVRDDGQSLHPAHLLESPVTIVVGRGTFTVVRPLPAEGSGGLQPAIRQVIDPVPRTEGPLMRFFGLLR